MIHIIQLILLPLAAFIRTITSTVRRPPTDHARFHRKKFFGVISVFFFHLFHHQRARSDNRDITDKYRKEIRQLIQTRFPQEMPESCNTRIVIDLVFSLILFYLLRRKRFFELVRIFFHRAEFRNPYFFSI